MHNSDSIAKRALEWHQAGRGAVLATVVETWGSAPRVAGSQLVIDASGAMEGSVSGGCVEAAVVIEAQEALAKGVARLLTYGVSDEDAFAAGLACGGTIRVLVEPVDTVFPLEILENLVAAEHSRRPIGVHQFLSGGGHRLIAPPESAERFRQDCSGIEDDADTFVLVLNPPVRLVIVGAVHIAQFLVPMARIAGFDPILVDPRPAFASTSRFPDEPILQDWPDDALDTIGLDAHTAVVTLTHDPKLDDPAIIASLNSDVFYLGCLGSRNTHAKRIDRLQKIGVLGAEIDRIHAPVGLDIGSRQPAEIAASIVAQIIQTLRKL